MTAIIHIETHYLKIPPLNICAVTNKRTKKQSLSSLINKNNCQTQGTLDKVEVVEIMWYG